MLPGFFWCTLFWYEILVIVLVVSLLTTQNTKSTNSIVQWLAMFNARITYEHNYND